MKKGKEPLGQIAIKNNTDSWDRYWLLPLVEIREVGLYFVGNGETTGNVCIEE